MSLLGGLMHTMARTEFRGHFLLASLLARLAGKERLCHVSFAGRVSTVVDLSVSKYWFLKLGKFEEGVGRLFVTALREGDVVYDVGANWGFYTLLSAALVGESGSVAAFEPGAASFAQLQSHVSSARLLQVKLEHCAVTETSGSTVR